VALNVIVILFPGQLKSKTLKSRLKPQLNIREKFKHWFLVAALKNLIANCQGFNTNL
jgi:hypothetical protein